MKKMKEIQLDENSTDCLKMGDFVLKFENNENSLEEDYLKKAGEELRENPEIRRTALNELKELISKHKNIYLPLDDDSDAYLYAYLRACKYYVSSAFERMQCFFNLRLKYPEYFSNLVPLTERSAYENNLLTILPNRDQHGRRMLVVRMGKKWKPSKCSLLKIVRACIVAVDGAILEPKTQIAGAILILDMEGFSLQHVWQFTPAFAKMLLIWIQDAAPLRLKAIHVVNQPLIFNMAFAVFKPFLKGKLSSRIHFHGSDKFSLLKYMDAKYLPVQYGGIMKVPMNYGLEQWKFLCNYNDRYEKTSQYGFDEDFKPENVENK